MLTLLTSKNSCVHYRPFLFAEVEWLHLYVYLHALFRVPRRTVLLNAFVQQFKKIRKIRAKPFNFPLTSEPKKLNIWNSDDFKVSEVHQQVLKTTGVIYLY